VPAGRPTHHIRLLLAALLLASAPAHAAKDTYARGLKAAGDGNWAEAEARMREALADDATPVPRALMYGRVFEPYVPQYFLGIAAYKRGDCAAAVRNLQHGPTRAAVADSKARPRLSKFAGVADQALRECEQKAVAVVPPPPPPPPVNNEAAQREAAQREAAQREAAQREAARVELAKQEAAKREAARREAELKAAQKQTVPPPPPPPVVPTAVPAPAAVAAALDNFLRGKYVEAASVNPTALADAKAKFHALLLRAASRHTLAQVAGDPGNVLMGQAATDVRAAKALQPTAKPDESLYSPRFRQFYSSTR